jgi:hypothetical protein
MRPDLDRGDGGAASQKRWAVEDYTAHRRFLIGGASNARTAIMESSDFHSAPARCLSPFHGFFS